MALHGVQQFGVQLSSLTSELNRKYSKSADKYLSPRTCVGQFLKIVDGWSFFTSIFTSTRPSKHRQSIRLYEPVLNALEVNCMWVEFVIMQCLKLDARSWAFATTEWMRCSRSWSLDPHSFELRISVQAFSWFSIFRLLSRLWQSYELHD